MLAVIILLIVISPVRMVRSEGIRACLDIVSRAPSTENRQFPVNPILCTPFRNHGTRARDSAR
jgi:hypothetical protein